MAEHERSSADPLENLLEFETLIFDLPLGATSCRRRGRVPHFAP
jgi:hypothetical protein